MEILPVFTKQWTSLWNDPGRQIPNSLKKPEKLPVLDYHFVCSRKAFNTHVQDKQKKNRNQVEV